MVVDEKANWWERLKFRLWFWKLLLEAKSMSRKDKRMRKKYCHKGFHKLAKGFYSTDCGTNRKHLQVEYSRCAHCHYRFFATKEDKEKFIRMQNEWNSSAKEGFSALLKDSSSAKSKNLKASVSPESRESSARDRTPRMHSFGDRDPDSPIHKHSSFRRTVCGNIVKKEFVTNNQSKVNCKTCIRIEQKLKEKILKGGKTNGCTME